MQAGSQRPSAGEYEFTVDWFSLHCGAWPALLSELKPKRILEIGSYEGRSTTFLIENCSTHQSIEILCVDTWGGSLEHDRHAMATVEGRFDKNIAIARQRASHEVILRKVKKPSVMALAELIANGEPGFDMIYVDGSHEAPDVLQDAVLSFQLLNVGGLLVFDDYLWRLEPDGKQDAFNMPKPAIDAFVNIFQRKLSVVGGLLNWQIYVRKTFT